jgi:hypothetical protein
MLYAVARKYGQPTLAACLLMRMILDQVVDLDQREEWHGKVLARQGSGASCPHHGFRGLERRLAPFALLPSPK